jgi:hypothetical protein
VSQLIKTESIAINMEVFLNCYIWCLIEYIYICFTNLLNINLISLQEQVFLSHVEHSSVLLKTKFTEQHI